MELVDEMWEGEHRMAPYTIVAGFPGAFAAADSAMYEEKERRRTDTPQLSARRQREWSVADGR